MDNDNEKELNGESNSENGFHKEDIPLWLQGIEDSQDEETVPMKKDNAVPDQWIKEVPEDIGDGLSSPENDEDSSNSKGEDIPDWLDEEPESPSEISSDIGAAEDDATELSENTIEPESCIPMEGEAVNADLDENLQPDKNSELVQDLYEAEPPEEKFIEISKGGIVGEDHPNHDVRSLEDEELPYWLQEMIAEPSENESEKFQPESLETEEPFEEEEELDSDMVEENVLEGVHPSPETIQDMDESQMSDSETPYQYLTELIAEDNTKPVPIQHETQIGTEIPMHEEELEQIQPIEMPEDLQKAKVLFEEGDYSEAINTLNACQEKSAFHDDILSWLMTAAQGDASENCDVWEFIGDIELSEANPEEAMSAYTKAIYILLGKAKRSDEID